jgi:predicted aspartyl protease
MVKSTSVILRVREHRKAVKHADVAFFIDSGVAYSVIPGEILDKLDIEPYREMVFSLADGTSLKRKVSSAYFELEGEGGPATVVYGEEGDLPVLGSTTLESIGLVLNPFTRTLHPMRLLLAALKG